MNDDILFFFYKETSSQRPRSRCSYVPYISHQLPKKESMCTHIHIDTHALSDPDLDLRPFRVNIANSSHMTDLWKCYHFFKNTSPYYLYCSVISCIFSLHSTTAASTSIYSYLLLIKIQVVPIIYFYLKKTNI